MDVRVELAIRQIEEDAYARGWSDAFAHILEMTKRPPTINGYLRCETTIGLVMNFIESCPGNRGNVIVDYVTSRRPGKARKYLDRITRTYLTRLKDRRLIYQEDGAWYPGQMPQTQKAPHPQPEG